MWDPGCGAVRKNPLGPVQQTLSWQRPIHQSCTSCFASKQKPDFKTLNIVQVTGPSRQQNAELTEKCLFFFSQLVPLCVSYCSLHNVIGLLETRNQLSLVTTTDLKEVLQVFSPYFPPSSFHPAYTLHTQISSQSSLHKKTKQKHPRHFFLFFMSQFAVPTSLRSHG